MPTYAWTPTSAVAFNVKGRVSQYNATFNNNRFLHRDVLGVDEFFGDGTTIGTHALSPAKFSKLEAATGGQQIIRAQTDGGRVRVAGGPTLSGVGASAGVEVFGQSYGGTKSGTMWFRDANHRWAWEKADGTEVAAMFHDQFRLSHNIIARDVANDQLNLYGGTSGVPGSFLRLIGSSAGGSYGVRLNADGTTNPAIIRFSVTGVPGVSHNIHSDMYTEPTGIFNALKTYNPDDVNDWAELYADNTSPVVKFFRNGVMKMKLGPTGLIGYETSGGYSFQVGCDSTTSNEMTLLVNRVDDDIFNTGNISIANPGLSIFSGIWFAARNNGTFNYSIMRFRDIGDPTTPREGDIWYNGTNLKFRKSASTVNIA